MAPQRPYTWTQIEAPGDFASGGYGTVGHGKASRSRESPWEVEPVDGCEVVGVAGKLLGEGREHDVRGGIQAMGRYLLM